MRNLKRVLSLGVTAAMISGLMVMGSSAASYADVTSEDNQEAIEVLQAVEIMVGDENGDFNPDQNVTRNEMAVIMCNLLNYTAASYADTCPFTDVPDWAEAYVAACYTNGIIAGYDATTFGGSDSVTTAQASLMLLKALGYFQYSADFGSDWQLATISKGNTAGLYSGVSASATQALSRNDAAQMVLNALEANMVEADGGSGVTVEGDGFTVTTGSATYNDRTSTSSDYGVIDDERDSNDGRYVIQLGEDLYEGDLRKTTSTDDFGRPATVWNYNSNEIGTYSDEADATWTTTVTERDLYQAAGSTAYSNYTWNVYRNGEDVFTDLEGGADVLEYGRTSTERWQQTGYGVLTELFVDSSEETVTVSIIDTFVGEVTRVEDNGDDYTVTISYRSDRPSGAETTFDTEQQFEREDIVIVTVGSQEIQSMDVAETVEGTVTGVSSASYVRVDGVTYNYNRAYTGETGGRLGAGLVNLDDGGYGDAEVDNDVVIYLDSYGYAVAMEGAEAGVDDYLFVTGLDTAYDEVSAKVVWADGTEDTIDIDELDNVDVTDEDQLSVNTIYKWSTSGSAYDLESVDSVELNDADIRNGRASVINNYVSSEDHGTSYTASNSTVFVDADNNRVWTGYNEVTSKSSVEGALVLDGSVIEIVFISSSANSAAEADDYVYIADIGYETTTVDGDTVYIFDDAYINGEQVDLYTDSGARSTITRNGEGLYVIDEYDGTNEDWATQISPVVPIEDGADVGVDTTSHAVYASNGVLELYSEDTNMVSGNSSKTFSYDSNTVFMVVELKGDNNDTDDVYLGGVNDIEDAENLSDRDEYTTAVYVLAVEDDSDDTPLAELVLVLMPNEDASSSSGDNASRPYLTDAANMDDVTYALGEEVNDLNASADAIRGEVTYQWYKGSTSDANAIDGEIKATYTPDISEVGETTYYCVITSTYNDTIATLTVSATVTVTKKAVESITVSGAPETVESGSELDTSSLVVRATYTDKTSGYLEEDEYTLSVTGPIYYEDSDDGTLTVTVTAGTATATFDVTVEARDSAITLGDNTAEVAKGGTTAVRVSISGGGTITDVVVSNESEYDNDQITATVSGSYLEISASGTATAGEYTITVSGVDEAGEAVDDVTLTLTVNE